VNICSLEAPALKGRDEDAGNGCTGTVAAL